ncbi:dihydroorotate dehydrogenase electron transfer subunit [Halobacillus yeomjeoni]|uniref:dihydroorotate dehydrogenase electron transfer subunit n=1 Tax=Halobacillus yeomjeoni TaxID=311194 RepID=UPI001CD32980|nr:dihydroorotate dehydrogenase electron transfer subunit [Halobacillus yeomjeoni]MCA0983543.1 dihydroorotate dehydrogenase electron transfer subunit [Halobacillus yeomjeoni]
MRREWMKVIEHKSIARDTYQLILKGDLIEEVDEPGKFVHIQINPEFFLRRPVSIADVDFHEQTLTLLYKVMGKGTDALTEKRVGDQLDVLGPGGRGFPVASLESKHALIIGGGIGVPPLYYLAKNLVERGIKVTSVLGFRSEADVFYEDEFRELGEVTVVTNDGSYGEKGLVTDVLPNLEPTIDTYFSCGPGVMLKAVTEHLPHLPGYISMEERMGCGIGACFACVVPTPDMDEKGYRRICCDGPVFKAEEVVL